MAACGQRDRLRAARARLNLRRERSRSRDRYTFVITLLVCGGGVVEPAQRRQMNFAAAVSSEAGGPATARRIFA